MQNVIACFTLVDLSSLSFKKYYQWSKFINIHWIETTWRHSNVETVHELQQERWRGAGESKCANCPLTAAQFPACPVQCKSQCFYPLSIEPIFMTESFITFKLFSPTSLFKLVFSHLSRSTCFSLDDLVNNPSSLFLYLINGESLCVPNFCIFTFEPIFPSQSLWLIHFYSCYPCFLQIDDNLFVSSFICRQDSDQIGTKQIILRSLSLLT